MGIARIMLGFHRIGDDIFRWNLMSRTAKVLAFLIVVLFATATPAQRPVQPDERDEALEFLGGQCKADYDLLTVCAREIFCGGSAAAH